MDSRDFFISHASQDEQWAEWIATQLQRSGYRIELDVWEWSPGVDFVAAMENGLQRAERVIAVLSTAYFSRPYAQAEYRAVFATSVAAKRPRVIPVRVEECTVPELYRTLIFIDIANVDEQTAIQRLLDGVAHPQPRTAVTYPWTPSVSPRDGKSYPGRLPPVWKMPPRNLFFVGREAVIQDIFRQLHASTGLDRAVAVASLQGMGGIGKTQTAIEYAYMHSQGYNIIWWVDADSAELIIDGLLELADQLSLKAGSPQKIVNKLWTELSQRNDWLLIYDNVDDVMSLAGQRPPANGHWILTSRNPAIARVATMIELSEFDRTESLMLLERRAPWVTRKEADRIATAVGDLPLAVEQAGYFLAETRFGAEEYLELLAKSPQTAGLDSPTIDRHPGLPTVVSASMRQLEAKNPSALRVLKTFALLAPEPVPVTPERSKADDLAFGVRLGDVTFTAGLIRDLVTFGLARRMERSLHMHRLIQLIITAGMSDNDRKGLEENAAALLAASRPGDPANTKDWPNYVVLMPHVEALVGRTPDITSWAAHAPFAELVLACVDYLYRAGRYHPGLNLAQLCLEQWQSMLGAEHYYTLRLTNNLGMCLTGLKEYGKATALYNELVSRYSATRGPTDPLTLRAANNVGVTLNGSGRYDESVVILNQALDGWNSTAGPEHVEAMRTADNLAEALIGAGDYVSAAQLAANTLETRLRLFSPDEPDTLECSFILGAALAEIDAIRARSLLADTLKAQKRILGPEHPNTIRTLTTLANFDGFPLACLDQRDS